MGAIGKLRLVATDGARGTVSYECMNSQTNGVAGQVTNLSANCNAAGTQATISWTAGTNNDRWNVRVDDNNNSSTSAMEMSGAMNNCPAGASHDVCINNWTSNSMTLNVKSGVEYRWWVHGANTSSVANEVFGTPFKCMASGMNGSTPMPTPSKTPPSMAPVPTGSVSTGTGFGVYNNPNNPEAGINLNEFSRITAEVASNVQTYSKLCPSHDPNKWHMLVDPVRKCHYDHQHGDDPSMVDDIFGQVGAWFGMSGTSISYPWQTFNIPANATSTIMPTASSQMENAYKHEGYTWYVRRNQWCEGGSNCVRAFRIQLHNHGPIMDAKVRWHSFSAEVQVCSQRDQNCGTAQFGGWIDTGILFVPPLNAFDFGTSCDLGFNAVIEGKPGALAQFANELGLYNQFVPRNADDPRDEGRCHKQIPANLISEMPNGLSGPRTAAEWWLHGQTKDIRFFTSAFNPAAEVDVNGNWTVYCKLGDTKCRWTQGRNALEMDYTFDTHGSGSWSGWSTRSGAQANCTQSSMDCIPYKYTNIPVAPSSRFQHDRNRGASVSDYDITPVGIPSWITWFHHM